MYIYDHIEEVHLKNKEMLRAKKLKHATEEESESESEFDTAFCLTLLQRRNGLIDRDQSTINMHVIDTQSQLHSSHTPTIADHLTVVTSTNTSSVIRFEELCLILLRGVMERLSLQISPCQNRYIVYL